jgi:hypothetical protein
MKRSSFALAAILTAMPIAAQESAATHEHEAKGGKVIILARELEMRLAVDALPPHLREGAGIWILTETGYIKAKDAANAFTCIVSRRGGNFYPVCFDQEGSRTILPAYMDDASMRLKGESEESVERHIADGFASGKYRPPTRPGIAYMLSPATYLLNNGKLTRAVAHIMFYAPYLTDEDIGGVMGKTPFVDRPGPHGMIIVPAGQKERETRLAESRPLIDEVERAIGLTP